MSNHSSRESPAVVVKGLTKRYGPKTVLCDLSFEIAQGETFALLGPNGAGKSTSVGILTGTVRPSSGELQVLGLDPVTAGRAWRSRVGVVAQHGGGVGPVTVREAVRHFAGLYSHARDPQEVIEAVGLSAQANTRITRLSGGQQRRVDVALGIIGSPELLFLDEPTTGFDPAARRQFWSLIRRLQGEGTTIVLTTHYLDEAAHLADRAAVVAGGRLVALDAIDRLGGEDARTPVVRWRDTSGEDREERTTEPGALVAQLVAAQGGEPDELQIIRPSLEDIYLGLIGHDRGPDVSGADVSGADASGAHL